ncbi:PREDICTED: E3 ubiquitin-protein ligase RNF144A-like [Nelumbo nucifera]|uniref:RBR-type E3 ubiquitin transferase n=1 Tax=Nelumbo nucifera TaxID=4432 RepID=A0A1U8A973_NELNU|nr:PREDICTED: E3 ubiquitin-protein ligase RNF144A-like [Nelumbo nucifera]
MENPPLDELYLSALADGEVMFPISDEKYAEELQFQEVLMSSIISFRMAAAGTSTMEGQLMEGITSSQMDAGSLGIVEPPMEEVGCSQMGDEVSRLEAQEKHRIDTKLMIKRRKIEPGESSQCFCEICMEGKAAAEMFKNKTCTHSYCTDCICKYVAAKIEENVNMVKCPDVNCEGLLDPDHCRAIIPEEVFDRWGKALCESVILGSLKIFCPFTDCSVMLLDDGGQVVKQSECPNCRRLFCAQCKVPWHSGIGCEEFQSLNEGDRKKEDLMMIELANNKKWRRCPQCHYFVVKKDGCLHITCRCKFEFCYGCGRRWSPSENHGGCRSE